MHLSIFSVLFPFALVNLGLPIASVVVGRKTAPGSPWRHRYAWFAVVVGSLWELFLAVVLIWGTAILIERWGTSKFPEDVVLGILSLLLVLALVGLVSLVLAVRLLRNRTVAGSE